MHNPTRWLIAAAIAGALLESAVMAQTTVKLHAAGSLKAALTEVAAAFQRQEGIAVVPAHGPSGALKGRIEKSEAAEVFASANMEHPLALHAAGKAGPVALFARNRLCALIQPGVNATPATLLDAMLNPALKLGTSTPQSDPSGDYAWEVFHKAERLRPGSYAKLDAKALQLTGRPDSPQPPAGRNAYPWNMEQHHADVFLTYCTNAAESLKQVPGLKSVALPDDLAVGADYGLTVLLNAPAPAWRFAMFILSPPGQAILAAHGFGAPGLAESGK